MFTFYLHFCTFPHTHSQYFFYKNVCMHWCALRLFSLYFWLALKYAFYKVAQVSKCVCVLLFLYMYVKSERVCVFVYQFVVVKYARRFIVCRLLFKLFSFHKFLFFFFLIFILQLMCTFIYFVLCFEHILEIIIFWGGGRRCQIVSQKLNEKNKNQSQTPAFLLILQVQKKKKGRNV